MANRPAAFRSATSWRRPSGVRIVSRSTRPVASVSLATHHLAFISGHAAVHCRYPLEPRTEQIVRRRLAAHPVLADADDVALLVDLVRAHGNLVEGDVHRVRDVIPLVLPVVADVDDQRGRV